MADYIINFTDPANGSFVIKPMTTNGPASPTALTPLDPQAVSANTSIVLLGKGMWQYGERVAESFVHMLEHFAYSTPPVYPIQGQMWFKNDAPQGLFVYDGAAWQPVLIGSFPITADLDMGGFKIVNLGAPTNPNDAVNLQYANTNFVNISGDTMTGSLIMSGGATQIVQPNAPVVNNDLTNKLYVDTLVSTTAANYVLKAGDTMTGTLFINGGDLVIQSTGAFTAGTGLFDMNAQRIQNMAQPVNPQDATTKNYVDTLFAGAGADGVVYNGIYTLGTHTLTLQRTLGLPDVNITGIAGVGDIWQTVDIRHPLNPSYNSSFFRETFINNVLFPNNIPFSNVVDAIDQTLYSSTAIPKRLILQGDNLTTTFDVTNGFVFNYTTYTNKLAVYNNGIKQYAHQRGHFIIDFESPTVNVATDTGLAALAYDFIIVVDNIPYNVTVNLTAATLPINYNTLITEIDAGLVLAGVPVTIRFRDSRLNFISDTQGRLSSVYLNIASGTVPLFTAITGTTLSPSPLTSFVSVLTAATGPNQFTVTGDYSTSFPTGTLFVVFGSTSNDGTYEVAAPGASFGAGVTTIPVTTAVTPSGASGTIFFSRTLNYAENGSVYSPTSQGNEITFETASMPAAGDLLEVVILP